MKRYGLIGLLGLLLAVTAWAAVINVPEAPARMTAVVVGGGGGGAAPAGSYVYPYAYGESSFVDGSFGDGTYATGAPIALSTGTVTKLGVYVKHSASAINGAVCLLNSSQSCLGCGTIATTGTSLAWVDATVSIAVSAGTHYVMVLWEGAGAANGWKTYESGNPGRYDNNKSAYNGATCPTGWNGSNDTDSCYGARVYQ